MLQWAHEFAASLLRSHLHGPGTQTIAVPEEQNTRSGVDSALAGLDPLAPSGALPHGLNEANGALLGIGAIVLAHDRLDGLGGLVGVVEGDGADVVVQDVGLDDTVEEVAADEAKLTVDGRGGATDEVPLIGSVVREGGVGVLEESDGN